MLIGSRPSKVAFPILAHLARAEGERPLRARDLSAAAEVAKAPAARILRIMVRRGLLAVRQGPGGGYLLRVPPHELTLERIRSDLGEESFLPACLEGDECGQRNASCPMSGPWHRVCEAVEEFFRTTTLGDLAGLPEGASQAHGGLEKG